MRPAGYAPLRDATLVYDGGGTLHIVLRQEQMPSRTDAVLTVRRISNVIGFALEPDPVMVKVP